jgi:uncharacterized protein YdhG (YjbR/CyaY superfamily)
LSTSSKSTESFTADERAAMKERAAEAKRAKSGKGAAADLAACEEKIAEMHPEDRALAQTIHDIVTSTAPDLAPKTWYGMPAYAKDGRVVCFFKPAHKFKSRYATLGFEDAATVDDGTFWPTSYALVAIGPAEHKAITALVKKAAG